MTKLLGLHLNEHLTWDDHKDLYLLPAKHKAFTNNWFNETYQLHLSRQDLVDLLTATKDQLFIFNGQLFEQTDVVTMGSTLGPVLANVFMYSIKERLEQEGKMPTYYRRFVDDTLTIMPIESFRSEFTANL